MFSIGMASSTADDGIIIGIFSTRGRLQLPLSPSVSLGPHAMRPNELTLSIAFVGATNNSLSRVLYPRMSLAVGEVGDNRQMCCLGQGVDDYGVHKGY